MSKQSRIVEDTVSTASNAVTAGIGHLFAMALAYVTAIVITRALGASDYGRYVLVMTLFSLASTVARLGMADSALRFIPSYLAKKQVEAARAFVLFALGLVGVAGTGFAVVLIFTGDSVAKLFRSQYSVGDLVTVFSFMVPLLTLITVGLRVLQAIRLVRLRVVVEHVLVPALRLGGVLLLVVALGAGASGALAAGAVATVVGLATVFWWLRRQLPVVGRLQGQFQWQSWLKFSSSLALREFFIFAVDNSDIYVIGAFLTAQEVGIYNAGLKLALIIIAPLIAVNMAFSPLIAQYWALEDLKALATLYKTVTRWLVSVSFPIFLVCVIFAEPLMAVFGKGFVSGAAVLRLIAIGQLVNVSVGSAGYMIMMTGHSKLTLLNDALGAIVRIGIALVLVRYYGVVGVAIAGGVSIIFVNLLRLVEVRVLVGIHPYGAAYWRPLLAGVTCGGAFSFLLPTLNRRGMEILGLVPVFLIAYFGLLALLGFTDDDRLVLRNGRRWLGQLLAVLGLPGLTR